MFSSFFGRRGLKRLSPITVIIGVSAALLAGTITTTMAATSPSQGLFVSAKSDRSAPRALSGTNLNGKQYIFVAGYSNVASVTFYLDSSTTPVRTERYVAYDFAATAGDGTAYPFDVNTLKAGTHTIRYVVAYNNTTATGSASFTTGVLATTTTSTSRPATTTTSSTTTPQPPTPPSNPLGLDASGKTIPDTNYAIPTGAIFMSTSGADSNAGTQTAPVKSINRAIELVPAGGTIVVRGGVYRDFYNDGTSYKIANKSLTLQAYPHEQPWFDGTDIVPSNQWQSDGQGHWSVQWSTPTFCNGGYYKFPYAKQPTDNTGPCGHFDMVNEDINTAHPTAGDPQMAFIDGGAQQEVAALSQVKAGTFYYAQDLANKTGRLYIGVDPKGRTIELAKRPAAFVGGGQSSSYAIKGIGFRRYATHEYQGINAAVYLSGGASNRIENSVITQMASTGLYVAPRNGVVEHTALVQNGHVGMGSNGSSTTNGTNQLSIQNSLISHNNTEGYGYGCSRSCGQAGIKIAHMVGFTVKNNIFEYNDGGAGFWCDEDCSNGVMVNNISRYNQAGLFYEVSDTGIIASNLIYGNTSYGINVGSANTKIYNNTIADNGTIDIRIYDDSRNASNLRGSDVGPDTKNIDVKNNVVSSKAVNTLWAARSDSTSTNTGPNTFFSGLDYNSYHRQLGANRVLMRWIDGSDNYYRSLTDFAAARGWESHGQDITTATDPFFVNKAGGNFNLRTDSPAYKSGTALPADVAAAIGVSASAGQSRGAFTWPGK